MPEIFPGADLHDDVLRLVLWLQAACEHLGGHGTDDLPNIVGRRGHLPPGGDFSSSLDQYSHTFVALDVAEDWLDDGFSTSIDGLAGRCSQARKVAQVRLASRLCHDGDRLGSTPFKELTTALKRTAGTEVGSQFDDGHTVIAA